MKIGVNGAVRGGNLAALELLLPNPRPTPLASGHGSAVLDAFNDAGHQVRLHLAVRGLPGSGTPAELIEAAGISAGQIAQAARELLGA